MLRAFRQLNLSDAQRQRLRTILMSARDSARQRREGRSGAAAARQSLAAIVNPGDPNYARAVQAAKDLAVQRIQQATQTQQALYAVLTPAQKTQLSQIFAQRRARRQQFEQRAAGRRSGSAPRGGAPDGAQPGGTP
ncbi:MAG TPA: Spy/CpxP family protein refolding chaperone [Steroidobacteraceae bacterium]|nr:Spy/CpxP family protein refolding chaperone [Steroidobacteraceae bacterium]